MNEHKNPKQAPLPDEPPLVVDLDGTLIKTELPWESFVSVLTRHPVRLVKILKKKLKTKKPGFFKTELEKWAELSLQNMPFSENFLNWLKEEKARGRRLILCTGSTQAYADRIQQITGLFDEVYGSTLGKNLSGRKKAMFLVGKYGDKQFDYAGNSLMDFKVAPHARYFILVSPGFLTSFFSGKVKVYRRFLKKEANPSFFARTLGFPLWFLNCLVFVPALFMSSSLNNLFFALAFSTVHFNFSATAFCLFFNMVYANRDREHADSGNLFATGDLSLHLGCLLSGFCFILTFVSLVYLCISRPLSFIPSLLYMGLLYLNLRKKILGRDVPVFIVYILLSAVVALQGLLIVS